MAALPPSVIFRQPPPPRRHLTVGNNEQGNTVMVGGHCESVNCSNLRPYLFRKCKKMRPTNVEFLSEDFFFEVLVHLSAQDIYDLARLVCHKWYRMIYTDNFIHSHLQCSTSGLLIQSACLLEHPIFISLQQGRIDVTDYGYRFRCVVQGGCNGLTLGYELRKHYTYYILNPATKQHFAVPPFCHQIMHRSKSGIAYAPTSMEYKVVMPYYNGECFDLYILTVGVDNSWRQIDTQHLSPEAKKRFYNTPLITQGFMHWANFWLHVLTLNVETEIVTETRVPLPQVDVHTTNISYLSTGRYLTSLVVCGDFSWEVWEMKPESGEWTKWGNVEVGAAKLRLLEMGFENYESLIPVGWLNYPEVLVFRMAGIPRRKPGARSPRSENFFLLFYNLHTHEINSIRSPDMTILYRYTVHTNTLEWLTRD